MQTKRSSIVETVVGTAAGFLISWAMWAWVVAPLFDIPYAGGHGLWITALFTVTSVLRSYAIRRIFNWWDHGRKR